MLHLQLARESWYSDRARPILLSMAVAAVFRQNRLVVLASGVLALFLRRGLDNQGISGQRTSAIAIPPGGWVRALRGHGRSIGGQAQSTPRAPASYRAEEEGTRSRSHHHRGQV